MKRRTKTKRLQMIVHEYERRRPGAFTMNEVASWAMLSGLFPIPGRLSDEADEAAAWDKRFAELVAEDVVPVPSSH